MMYPSSPTPTKTMSTDSTDTTTTTRLTLSKTISSADTTTNTMAGSETISSSSTRPVARRALVGQKCLGGLRNILLIIFGYTLQLIHLQSQFHYYPPSSSSSRSMLALSSNNNAASSGGGSDNINQLAVPERDVTTALQKALEDFKEMGGGMDDSSNPIIDPEILKLLKQMTAAAPQKRYDEYNCTLATGVQISLPPVPTFIVAGVQKGGTSALHSLLRKHPLLVAPKKFEPHFFDSNPIMKMVNDTSLLSKGDICLLRELYSRNFKLHRLRRYPQMLSFEKTPSYMVTTEAPERIKVVAPWAKIIVTLRNPVDRCFSHYKMKVERNQIPENQTFNEHLAMDLEVLRRKQRFVLPRPDEQPFPEITDVRDSRVTAYWKIKNLLYRGFYAEQLQNWINHGYEIGHDLLVIRYERLNEEPAVVFDEILDFLNVPRHDYRDDHFNKSYSPSRHWGARNDLFPSDETRQFLKDFYKPYNEQLADMLGEEWRDVWSGRTFY